MFRGVVSDIFFDLDHTLWDFEKNSELTFQKILSKNQVSVVLNDFMSVYRPINLEYWKMYRENRISKPDLRYQRLKRSFDALHFPISDDTILVLADEYIEHLSSFQHLIPNAVEVLEYLSPNYRLHIITNGFQEIQEKKMRNSNIHHFFEHVIDSESVGVKKPHPRIFKFALEKAQVPAHRSLMIGDNMEADVLGARYLGFHTVHFNAHADGDPNLCKTIDDLLEIKSIL
ncbi:YjjG family noncanonical pyrimidine nucleotidase [Flagellimonas allohymeniacidonis]|uniref:Noncanonical pyrimidine nucleotidase, YjjG family n=1 Tax=Flagellimonas allohymeniacidonis TaxID=2517819 RepID=A0A4Q8QK20_9FLAO|nr:YjjG family noncanonical pyrimidine nucleotidase [Allomuricauda hymeniacidonis]TAI49688.1 noncanonical pyrimidine nucleotidase, YjjG family [Allomuricauda hymeniacidonis]